MVRDLAEDGSQKRARTQPCWPAAVVLRPPAGSQACLLTASPVHCHAGSQPRGSHPSWFKFSLAQSLAVSLCCCPAAFHRLSGSPLLARSPDGSNPCWFAAAVAQTLTVQMPAGSQPRCFKAVLAQGPLGSQPCWFKSPLVYSSILCWLVVGWFVLCSSFAFGFLIFWFAVLLAHSFPDSTVGSQPCWFTGPG